MKGFHYVAIEREYASGGAQVGRLLGGLWGVPVYGREILEMAAREGGSTPEYIEHLEETATSSLLYSLAAMAKAAQGQLPQLSQADQLSLMEGQVIRRLAQQGPCVLVGRCAGWVLGERKDVLRVFVHGDREARLRRAQEEYGIPPEKALGILRRYDHRRANFYRANTGRDWNRREGYHLVLDSGLLGVELCAQILWGAVQASWGD